MHGSRAEILQGLQAHRQLSNLSRIPPARQHIQRRPLRRLHGHAQLDAVGAWCRGCGGGGGNALFRRSDGRRHISDQFAARLVHQHLQLVT